MLALAERRLSEGAARDAQLLAEAVLAAAPASIPARLIANQAAFIAGDLVAAMAHAEAGLALDPGSPDFHLRRARCLLIRNDPTAARRALSAASHCAGARATAAPWGMIGDAWTLLGDFMQAIAAYDEAIAQESANPRHLFNRGVVRRYVGQSERAEQDYAQTVALAPEHGEAWLNRVQLGRQTPQSHHLAALEQVLHRLPDRPEVVPARIHVHYALAKTHEDLGDGDRCFHHLGEGARLLRQTFRYDVRSDLAVLAAAQAAAPPPPPVSPFSGAVPIFVLGLPRSGSTLVERILTAHDRVGTIGESPAFGRALADAAHADGLDPADAAALMARAPALDLAAIGRRYLDLTAPWRGSEPFFVDKLPNNHVHAALIAAALPQARIIHIHRDPVANLFGMYKTLFNGAYPYSYDWDELIAYYRGYRQLMDTWRHSLGGRMIELRYETLVEAPEATIRTLVAACELDWQEQCLNFHANPLPCTTQSASQVRKQLNRDGIDGLPRFARQLQPLRDRLAQVL